MNSRTTKKFWKAYNKLPDQIKKQAKETFTLFRNDPNHPSLHFKRIHSSLPIYSTRISRDYRVIEIQEETDIIWFWIGSHSDYENMLKIL